MVVSGMQALTTGLTGLTHWDEALFLLVWKLPLNSPVLAQTVTDPDIMGQMQRSFNHFVQSGQVWALIIGVILGYMFRSLTSS